MSFDELHGQTTTDQPDGRLELSCEKQIEHGWRAAVLLAPGLFRCDVRPYPDTLQVMLRPLYDGPWGAHNQHVVAGPPWHGTWLCNLADGATAEVDVTVEWLDGCARVTGHAVVHDAGRIAPRT